MGCTLFSYAAKAQATTAWNSYATPHGPQAPFGHTWNLENDTVVSILSKPAAIPDNLICLLQRASNDVASGSGSESEDDSVSGTGAESIVSDESESDVEL